MKRYEGLFILNTAGKEENIKDALDKISADITAVGGKIETVQKMERKPFARVAEKSTTPDTTPTLSSQADPPLLPR